MNPDIVSAVSVYSTSAYNLRYIQCTILTMIKTMVNNYIVLLKIILSLRETIVALGRALGIILNPHFADLIGRGYISEYVQLTPGSREVFGA